MKRLKTRTLREYARDLFLGTGCNDELWRMTTARYLRSRKHRRSEAGGALEFKFWSRFEE